MDKTSIIYTALFVDNPEVLLMDFEPIHQIAYGHHSTIRFKPESLAGIAVGKKHSINIIGRVSDEKADALLVENPLSENEHPHITISTIKGVAPIYSNKMLETAKQKHIIEYFHEPIPLDVTEGYFDGENDITS
tara:strand:- start:1005 stop:1406 length:402 start_codon:yes stop_codon:yes gene_type:complete